MKILKICVALFSVSMLTCSHAAKVANREDLLTQALGEAIQEEKIKIIRPLLLADVGEENQIATLLMRSLSRYKDFVEEGKDFLAWDEADSNRIFIFKLLIQISFKRFGRVPFEITQYMQSLPKDQGDNNEFPKWFYAIQKQIKDESAKEQGAKNAPGGAKFGQ